MYKGKALELLNQANIEVGDQVIVYLSNNNVYEGIIMPRYEYSDDEHIVLKLKNGYNIGISISKIKTIKIKEKRSVNKITSLPKNKNKNIDLPRIALISTGGTIASKIDYRTGGVTPIVSASELYEAIPELSDIAIIEPEELFNEYSENLKFKHWEVIAESVYRKSKEGYRGIIITHGTDTLHYTAAALSFSLSIKLPIVLVGAQRSSDRPSSDAATNLIAATLFTTTTDQQGVFVAMHDNVSDDTIAIHIGTRVRKSHTSRRDAFRSIGIKPLAYVKNSREIIYNYKLNGKEEEYIKPRFEEKVALLKYYPNMDSKIIEKLIELNYKGIVFEGTGMGHISKDLFNVVERCIKEGMLVCMTSQCIEGRVRMTVYSTGRDLLNIGVIPLEDMLPEIAFVKLAWVLANTNSIEEAKNLMLKNLAYEINERSLFLK